MICQVKLLFLATQAYIVVPLSHLDTEIQRLTACADHDFILWGLLMEVY